MRLSVHAHKKQKQFVNCLIVTISDTRTIETDKSGNLIMQLLKSAGYVVEDRKIVRDRKEEIDQIIERGCKNPKINAIIMSGGTGIADKDVTFEIVEKKLHKEMKGFGELFRMLSYMEDIGSAAMLSRAIAGVYEHTAIFALPGSSGAVKLAMNKLILPELHHIIHEINKGT